MKNEHLEELKKSGLTEETIEALGFYSVEDDEGRELLNWDGEGTCKDASGLAVPYPDDPDDYTKIKLDNPPPKPGQKPPRLGDWHSEGDIDPDWEPELTGKYRGPTGMEARPYVPRPLLESLSRDPTLIVEGEKKAACAAQYGVYAIGIPGVYNMHDAKARKQGQSNGNDTKILHPLLKEELAEAKRAIICFDFPDMDGSNPQVVKAAVQGARMLMEEAKEVSIAYIPGEGYDKMGLDDYLVSLPERERSRRLQQLLQDALPVAPKKLAQRLAGYNPDHRLLQRAFVLAAAFFRNKKKFHTWVKSVEKLGVSPDDTQTVLGKIESTLQALFGWNEPNTWVREYMEKRGITYTLRGVFIQRGKAVDSVYVVNAATITSSNQQTGIREGILEAAIENWQKDQQAMAVEAVRAILAFQRNVFNNPVADWVQAVTGQRDPLDVAVMQHLVWQVKRKLHGLPVEHHLMPIICGKTGSGKSVAIQKLLKPVEDICAEPGELTILADERHAFRLSQSYVMFFDEMARAEHVAVESLKRSITSPTVEWRRMGTNITAKAPNNTTFIGASNKDVQSIIYDPTSARRFYQIESMDKTNWEAINGMDMLAVWRSVDHTQESPVIPFLEELRSAQEAIRAMTPVEEWVKEMGYAKAEPGGEPVWDKELYDSYTAWMKDQGKKAVVLRHFRKGLQDIFGKNVIGARSTKNRYPVLIYETNEAKDVRKPEELPRRGVLTQKSDTTVMN